MLAWTTRSNCGTVLAWGNAACRGMAAWINSCPCLDRAACWHATGDSEAPRGRIEGASTKLPVGAQRKSSKRWSNRFSGGRGRGRNLPPPVGPEPPPPVAEAGGAGPTRQRAWQASALPCDYAELWGKQADESSMRHRAQSAPAQLCDNAELRGRAGQAVAPPCDYAELWGMKAGAGPMRQRVQRAIVLSVRLCRIATLYSESILPSYAPRPSVTPYTP